MLCDDSATIRAILARMLESDPGIRVVARAANGRAAVEMMRPGLADVLVLDVEMPEMDGLTALPLLRQADPALRILMASTLTVRGADIALRALRLGATDYLHKPSAGVLAAAAGFRDELLAKVKFLGRQRRGVALVPSAPLLLRPAPLLKPNLLAIGSSTGGPQALMTLFAALPPALGVPVVLTQHMPAGFTAILAEHLTKVGRLAVAEAQDGAPLLADRVYLAPGDRHLLVGAVAGGLGASLSQDAPENFCRPAVDPMLRSATIATGGRTLAVILTGMGHDGRAGAEALVAAGGTVLAQDEASSVVWGMPGAVARAGLAHAVLPLEALAPRVRSLLRA